VKEQKPWIEDRRQHITVDVEMIQDLFVEYLIMKKEDLSQIK